jgi:very-short-patch-repair endonuclease
MRQHNSSLKKRSQELRKGKNATKQEKHLWYDFLRDYRPRFHRQVVIRSHIVDFYCPQAELVIELDGCQHYEDEASIYDKERTAILEGLHCHVLRFTNREVDCFFGDVCLRIDHEVRTLMKESKE